MTELPSAELNRSLGLQARTFRAKAGPDMSDRSGWTDTPADREKKAKVKKDTSNIIYLKVVYIDICLCHILLLKS